MKRVLPVIVFAFLLSAIGSAQTYTPVSLSGYNVDGIAEDTAAIDYTTQALDGSDYVLYSETYGNIYSTGNGLPDNGTITSGTRTYQLGDYDRSNILYLLQGATDSLVLDVPMAFAKLSILATSTEGAGINTYTLRFTDGTSTSFSNIALLDWFNGTGAIAAGIDRAGRTSGNPDYNSFDPNLYANDLSLTCVDQAKLVRSIVVANVGSHPRTLVFAVSGVAAASYNFTNHDPLCQGGLGSAYISPLTGASPFSYVWSTTPAQHSDTARGLMAGVYTVTATDGSGCTQLLYDTITNPVGSGVLNIIASADSVCPGTTVTLTTTGATSYSWSSGTATDSSITVNPGTTSTYSVTGTVGSGCTATGSISIFVRQAPIVGTTVTPSSHVCRGTAVTLSGTGALSYLWSNSINNGSPFLPIGDSITFTVTGADAYNCSATSSINIYTTPLPVVTAHVTPSDTVCIGSSLSLSGTGAVTYAWTGGVLNGTAFNAPGTNTLYKVTGTDNHGCVNSDSILIHVKALPIIGASVSPSDTVCAGTSISLNGTGGASYQWSGGITNAVAFVATTSASYTVTGTAANGCTNTATIAIVVKNCLGIGETDNDLQLMVYPNPSTGIFSLRTAMAMANVHISLTDMQGREIYNETTDLNAGDSKSLNISSAAPGIYILKIENGKQLFAEKIIVQ